MFKVNRKFSEGQQWKILQRREGNKRINLNSDDQIDVEELNIERLKTNAAESQLL